MQGQRAEGKKMIGAHVSAELWRGVDLWLQRNVGKTVTDFVVAACVEKLDQSGIEINEEAVLRDHRGRVPVARPGEPVSYSNSKTASAKTNALKKASASALRHGSK